MGFSNPRCSNKNIKSKHMFILVTEFRFAHWMWHFSPIKGSSCDKRASECHHMGAWVPPL
jgi:hypothetical protein